MSLLTIIILAAIGIVLSFILLREAYWKIQTRRSRVSAEEAAPIQDYIFYVNKPDKVIKIEQYGEIRNLPVWNFPSEDCPEGHHFSWDGQAKGYVMICTTDDSIICGAEA